MKVAFFVEGYTELLLIKKLILYNYTPENISYGLFSIRGKKNTIPCVSLIEKHLSTKEVADHTFNVYDCSGYSALQSMMNHQATSLYNSGFDKMVGIRDVHPNLRSEIPKLKLAMPYRVPQKPIPKYFMLCVMETEAWFIANGPHFLQISTTLTRDHILANTGINIDEIDVETIDLPAHTLHKIYSLVGESYQKSVMGTIARTINALDIFQLITDTAEKCPSLKELIRHIDPN